MAQAIVLVPEFDKAIRKPEQQAVLGGQSKIALNNYNRRIAFCVVNFGKLSKLIDPEQINGYLVALARDPKSSSQRISSAWFTGWATITACWG